MHVMPKTFSCFPSCCLSSPKKIAMSLQSPIWTTRQNYLNKDIGRLYLRAASAFLKNGKELKGDFPAKSFCMTAKKNINMLHLVFFLVQIFSRSIFSERYFHDFMETQRRLLRGSRTTVDIIFYNGIKLFASNNGPKRFC